MKNYTLFHLHSDFSLLDSATKFDWYIQKAKELEMSSICFSEHGNFYNWVKKKQYCDKAGLKYIHGQEFYVTDSIETKIRDNHHCILIAKNWEGVKELNRMSSVAHQKDGHFYYDPRITSKELFNTSKNIIVSTSCLGGILNSGNESLKQRFIDFIVDNKDRCFLEIQHHNDRNGEQARYNRWLHDLSNRHQLNLWAGTDTHSLNKDFADLRKILQKSKNINFSNEEDWDLNLKTYDDLVEAYKTQDALPRIVYLDAIENTNRLNDLVEDFKFDLSYKYPKVYDNSEEVFRAKVYEGLIKRGLQNNKKYTDRIEYEIAAIAKNGAIDYLLLQEKITSWCREHDIFPGPSRGSVSGSLCAYLLGITEIDSIKFNMNFERFMNAERVSLSDIDIDYPPDKRELVKDYVFNELGLQCCDIVAFNTVATKGAIRDVARALSIPLSEVNEICDNVENNKEKYEKLYPEIFKYSNLLEGVITSAGVHPCFTEDALVLTNSGYKKISNLKIGEYVFTHNSSYHKILDIIKSKSDHILNVNIMGVPTIKCTENHPFYVRSLNGRRFFDGKSSKSYGHPYWKDANNLTVGDWIGFPINNKSELPTSKYDLPFENETFWWILGKYIGDGWYEEVKNRNEKRLIICCEKKENELDEIMNNVSKLFKCRYIEERTTYKIFIKNLDFFEYVKQFGKYAPNKELTGDVLNLPINLLKSFLDGYLTSDGFYEEKTDTNRITTTSIKLLLGIEQAIAKVYKTHCHICYRSARTYVIEGRIVNGKESWQCIFSKNKKIGERGFYENEYLWIPFKNYERTERDTDVYNLSVDADNSYTVNGVSVHNCGVVTAALDIKEELGIFTTGTDTHPISQVDMKDVDYLNFVKLDILGLDNIQIINETCKLAGIERLNPDNVDFCDQKVWEDILVSNIGIFQWESDFAHQVYKRLFKKETLEKIKLVTGEINYLSLLSMGNGAIRPAGESYRDRMCNGEFNDNGHPALNELLKDTMGYLVYQEQIIEFLNKFCGYSMGKADVVRRGFAKKVGTEKFIPEIKSGFIKTMKDKYNVEEVEASNIVESFIRVIEDASLYLFSSNHSQPYSMIGYICAYLRYYYKLEFITSMLNINRSNMEKSSEIIKYAKECKINVVSPKFRKSKSSYFFDRETKTIYKDVSSVKFVNKDVGEELFEIGKLEFSGFMDLLKYIEENCKINSRQIETLIKLNFFSEFGGNKKLLNLYNEFSSGKNRYDKKLKETTKEKRFEILRDIESSSKNEILSVFDQILFEQEALGYIQATYPGVDKRYVYVVSIDEKFAPRVQIHSLATGKQVSVKVQKKIFEKNPFYGGEILYIGSFKEKPSVKFVDGKYVESEEDRTWWIENYKIVQPEDFDEKLE